ncbi:hypothetical protein [Sorangium sp. So ce1335]|uniref:hypothetical protein n=1 Tax=Sorangium sp. So ce1335 TaxID=3133335 RepID=UPI003F63529B
MASAIRFCLDRLDGKALTRLCEMRGLRCPRALDDRRSSISRSYRGDLDMFLGHLRREDLLAVLAQPVQVEGEWVYIKGHTGSDKDRLEHLVYQVLALDCIPKPFRGVEVAPPDEGEDEASEDDESEDDEDEEDEDEEADEDEEDEDEEADEDEDEADEADEDEADEDEADEDEADEDEADEDEDDGASGASDAAARARWQLRIHRLGHGVWSRPRSMAYVLERLGFDVPQRLRTTRFHALVSALNEVGLEMALDGSEEPLTLDDDSPGIHTAVRLRLASAPPATLPARATPPRAGSRSSDRTGAVPASPARDVLAPIIFVPSAPQPTPVATPRLRISDYELAALRLQFLTAAPSVYRERSPGWPETYLQAAMRGLSVGPLEANMLALRLRGWSRSSSSPEATIASLMKTLSPHEWDELLVEFRRLNLEAAGADDDVAEAVEMIVRHVFDLLNGVSAHVTPARATYTPAPPGYARAAVAATAATPVTHHTAPPSITAGAPAVRSVDVHERTGRTETPVNERSLGALDDIFK